MKTPPDRFDLDGVVMRRETADDAAVVADAIASNIPRLAPWMEWAVVEAADVEAQQARIADTRRQWDSGTAYDFLVLDAATDHALGKAGLNRRGDDWLELGYWLTADAEGHGIMTAVASTLTDIALELHDVSRVEIHCDAANLRSQAIPRRLGYRLARVVDHPITTPSQTGRQMIWIYDAS
ncbi:GNAT family N-acetyltransferase [Rhodococcoides kyotonense]|uniref:Protein N-acetyltransferase, RimJ/RimL family n=1 Tax=Rhodococcoides kyotonense TaxID=398843 RepID=A0A239L492_9NOCA|nr:GNAT family N-acetyltransferase [Rhodococcus kyotonensis]SNT25145.1 Protein N-acetyltransferase, RimJ/RimL family [Rhodococcus kyotonensis]